MKKNALSRFLPSLGLLALSAFCQAADTTSNQLLYLNYDQNIRDQSPFHFPTTVGCGLGAEKYTNAVFGSGFSVEENAVCVMTGGTQDSLSPLEGMAQLTMAVWAKKELPNGDGFIIRKEDARAIPYSVRILPRGFTVHLYTDHAFDLTADVANDDAKFHHYAVTYDSSMVRLYFDGNLVPASALSGPDALSGPILPHSSQSYSLITGPMGVDNPIFQGILDELRIYSRALSADDIAALTANATFPPVAHFSVSPDKGTTPLTVNFNGSTSDPGANSITDYIWSYGDGTTGHGANASHLYVSTGMYSFSLNVVNNANRTAQADGRVFVFPQPIPHVLLAFSFDDNYSDWSGRNRNVREGCVMGSTSQYTSGAEKQALLLNQAAPCIMVGGSQADIADLQGMSQLTLLAWVKKNATTSEGTIAVKQDSGLFPYRLRILAHGFSVHLYTSENVDVSADVPNADVRWHHYAVTYDASMVRLYFDGKQVAAKSTSGTILPSSGQSSGFMTGGYPPDLFLGAVDSMIVRDESLDGTAIQNIAATPQTPSNPSPGDGNGSTGSIGPTPSVQFLPFRNVFNPTKEVLTIPLSNVEAGAQLAVYDRKGQRVRDLTIVNGSAEWDGRNATADLVASGVYLLKLETGSEKQIRKIVVIK